MSTSQEQEFQEADIAVLFRNSFHGDWKPAVPGITREMLSQQTLSSTYYAYKFPNGDVWNSHHGWVVQDVAPEKTVFAEAEEIIYGDREQTYGHPAKNLKHIARQWNMYLHQKYGVASCITVEDVCWMMVDLKKTRQMNSAKRDNLVDAIGYIGLISRCE